MDIKDLKKTHIYEYHVAHGNVIDFGGYAMPVWYEGIKAEHAAVRNLARGLSEAGYPVDWVGVDADGRVDPAQAVDPRLIAERQVAHLDLNVIRCPVHGYRPERLRDQK